MGSWLAGATQLTSLNGFGLAQLRGGSTKELRMPGKEGLPVALAVAGLLQPSATTLTSIDFRRRCPLFLPLTSI